MSSGGGLCAPVRASSSPRARQPSHTTAHASAVTTAHRHLAADSMSPIPLEVDANSLCGPSIRLSSISYRPRLRVARCPPERARWTQRPPCPLAVYRLRISTHQLGESIRHIPRTPVVCLILCGLGRESTLRVPAGPAACGPQRYGSIAGRNPRLFSLCCGLSSSRSADRHRSARMLAQAPPRRTSVSPVPGPVGSLSGDSA